MRSPSIRTTAFGKILALAGSITVPLTSAVVPLAFAVNEERAARVKARKAIEQKRFMSERFLDFARNAQNVFSENPRGQLTPSGTTRCNKTVTWFCLQKWYRKESHVANIR